MKRKTSRYAPTQPASASSAYPQLTAKRWRYAGKEEQAGVTGLAYLDFGVRLYDPSIGLWLAPDPMTDDYPRFSPFVYCAADSVNIVDEKGLYTKVVATGD